MTIPLLIGTTPLARAAFQGSNEALKHLLRASGNNSSPMSERKMTPLLYACQQGHKETVRLLLDYRADPNLADDAGVTPLHLACFLGHAEIAEMLLDAGADTEIAIENEYTPERVAMVGGHRALKMLLQARSVNRTGRTRARFKSLSPCLQPPESAPAEAGGQAPEQQTGATSPPLLPSVPSGTTVTLPAAQPGQAATLPEPARESGTAGAEETSPATQKIAAPADSTITGPGSRTPSTELNSPLARAKHEVREDILMRLGNERLDHFNGIRLMEAVNLAADLDGLCGIYNRLAGIERKKLRNRRGRVLRPVPGAAAGAGLPDSGAAVFSLGDEQGLDADAIEGEIRKHAPQSRHRFVSQVVNDMEFGRGKPTSGYPGLLHVSSGIAGVGSCSVFYYTDEEGQQIRIAGIGRHLDRETYRLDYAIEELGGSGRTMRLA